MWRVIDAGDAVRALLYVAKLRIQRLESVSANVRLREESARASCDDAERRAGDQAFKLRERIAAFDAQYALLASDLYVYTGRVQALREENLAWREKVRFACNIHRQVVEELQQADYVLRMARKREIKFEEVVRCRGT